MGQTSSRVVLSSQGRAAGRARVGLSNPDYGDITKSSEQKPGTRKLGVPRTKPILGICSCDRGRHFVRILMVAQ
ncbi:hypothetical protein L2E82_28102 [Cichorium intybus]|uniref:Uncharacterized protein n=1 Tax=Cichorium intybus TaxID=13427 RepID=A0ACB9CUU5_CICIN|nr:hypothetical protein L2E82_28102 [Cichorium intybus]